MKTVFALTMISLMASSAFAKGVINVNFPTLTPEQQDIFLTKVVPALTISGKLSNAGNAKTAWYCIEYKTQDAAETQKINIGELLGESEIESLTFVTDECSAG